MWIGDKDFRKWSMLPVLPTYCCIFLEHSNSICFRICFIIPSILFPIGFQRAQTHCRCKQRARKVGLLWPITKLTGQAYWCVSTNTHMSSLSPINKSLPSNPYKPARFRSQVKLKEPIIINGAKTTCIEINHEVTVTEPNFTDPPGKSQVVPATGCMPTAMGDWEMSCDKSMSLWQTVSTT